MLFGFDPEPRIVAIEMGETGTVRVYRRQEDGSSSCEIEEIHPFVWADDDVADLGLTNAEKLAGDAKYNWLVTTDSWKEPIALRDGLKKAGRNFFALSDPVQHYLTQIVWRMALSYCAAGPPNISPVSQRKWADDL